MLRLGMQVLCRTSISHHLAAASPSVCSICSNGGVPQLLPFLGSLPQARWFSDNTNAGDGSAGADRLAAMLDVMMQDPSMQNMLMSRMPPHMRKPEVLRAMMANPDVKMRIVGLMQSAGMDKVMGDLNADRLKAGMEATRRLGVDPAALYAKLSQKPQLALKVANPRIFGALMDICQNPEHVKNYEGDKEILDVCMEAADLLEQMQTASQAAAGTHSADTAASSSSRSSSTNGSGSTREGHAPHAQHSGAAESSGQSHGPGSSHGPAEAMGKQLGIKPEELLQKLVARPDLMAKVNDPKVQKALIEVAGQPWKAAKYLFNKDVMSVLMSMKELLRNKP